MYSTTNTTQNFTFIIILWIHTYVVHITIFKHGILLFTYQNT